MKYQVCAISAVCAVIALLVAFGVMYQGEAAYSTTATPYQIVYNKNATELYATQQKQGWSTVTNFASYATGTYMINTGVGDHIYIPIYAYSTSMTISCLCTLNTDGGRLDINIDGTNTSEMEFYGATNLNYTVSKTLTVTPGLHLVNLTVGTKNPSSSSNNVLIQQLLITNP